MFMLLKLLNQYADLRFHLPYFLWRVSQQQTKSKLVAKKPTKEIADLIGGVSLAEKGEDKVFVEELYLLVRVGDHLAAGPTRTGHNHGSL